MGRLLKVIERAYARPPLCWTVTAVNWLANLLTIPLRPLFRRHARRKAAQLTGLSTALAAAGFGKESATFARLASEWNKVSETGRMIT